MLSLRAKLLLAFDAASVSGAVVAPGLGSPRFRRFARAPLAPGVVAPHPFEANVVRPDALIEALRRLRESLETNGHGARLLLPDGLARAAVIEASPGADPLDYARFRLAPGLPYAAGEAVVDGLSLPGGRFLAAAVRRSVLEGYEAVAIAAGFRPERVDLQPLCALAGLLQSTGPRETVDVILGDAAYSLAGFAGGELRVFRSRRRAPNGDEPARLEGEIERTAILVGTDGFPPTRFVGPGARALVRHFAQEGRAATLGWETRDESLPEDAAEVPWLAAALA